MKLSEKYGRQKNGRQISRPARGAQQPAQTVHDASVESRLSEQYAPGRSAAPEKIGHIHLKVDLDRKGFYVRAARKSQPRRSLESWILDVLDREILLPNLKYSP